MHQLCRCTSCAGDDSDVLRGHQGDPCHLPPAGCHLPPATCWLLSLLPLELTRTRRVSHVDDLLSDPTAGLLAGLATLPKKSALTEYSYQLSHDHQRAFLAALDKTMISSGLVV